MSSSGSEGSGSSSISACSASKQSESSNDSATSDSDQGIDDEESTSLSLSLSSCSDVNCGASDKEHMELPRIDPTEQSLRAAGNDQVGPFVFQTICFTVSWRPVAPLLLQSFWLCAVCVD